MSKDSGLISKEMAMFFGFIVLFLAITIIKIMFFEKKPIEKPVNVEISDESVIDGEDISERNSKRAKIVIKKMYDATTKRLENDVNEATKVFNESVQSLK